MGLVVELLGRNVAARRKQMGLTQAQLAERVKVSTETIGRLETGTSVPSLSRIEQVAVALGVELHVLLRFSQGDGARERALDRLWRIAAGRTVAEIELLVSLAQVLFEHLGGTARRSGLTAERSGQFRESMGSNPHAIPAASSTAPRPLKV